MHRRLFDRIVAPRTGYLIGLSYRIALRPRLARGRRLRERLTHRRRLGPRLLGRRGLARVTGVAWIARWHERQARCVRAVLAGTWELLRRAEPNSVELGTGVQQVRGGHVVRTCKCGARARRMKSRRRALFGAPRSRLYRAPVANARKQTGGRAVDGHRQLGALRGSAEGKVCEGLGPGPGALDAPERASSSPVLSG